jgi:hypothetical protein
VALPALSGQNPSDRDSFTTYCLRRLGKGVIKINVSPEQVTDRIDDALKWWWDYHFEGTEKTYFKYLVSQTDIANKYIVLPENIIGAINIFEFGDWYNVNNMFNIRYQIALNEMYTLTSVSVLTYWMARQHLQYVMDIFVGQQPVRYNRYNNKFYIDCDWTRMAPGQYLVIEAYQIIDPTVYTQAWADRWLQQYGTALIKRQWGENLKKFSGIQMPGGVTFNGQQIYNEAVAEIAYIEREVIHSYSLPVCDFIG